MPEVQVMTRDEAGKFIKKETIKKILKQSRPTLKERKAWARQEQD